MYSRGGKQYTTTVTPIRSSIDGTERWMIGVQLKSTLTFASLPFPQALSESVRRNAKTATMIYEILRGIVERRMSPKSLQGPIGIARASGAAAREGLRQVGVDVPVDDD